jgi:hypothetical protein
LRPDDNKTVSGCIPGLTLTTTTGILPKGMPRVVVSSSSTSSARKEAPVNQSYRKFFLIDLSILIVAGFILSILAGRFVR